jgi:hypothetical protein
MEKYFFRMMLGIQFENPHGVDISDPLLDEFYQYFRDVARKMRLFMKKFLQYYPVIV